MHARGERWLSGRIAAREVAILCCAAVGVLALGFYGFWLENPDGSPLDHLYHSIQLFVVAHEGSTPNWPLQVARYAAVLVAFYAVLRVLLVVLSGQITLYRAGRDRGHAVVVGSGPEVAGLARVVRREGARSKVSVVGELPEDDSAQLTAEGIRVLKGLSHRQLGSVLRDASRVVVVGDEDAETVRLVSRVTSAAPKAEPIVVLESPELTREWLQGGAGGSRPVCRATQVALEALRRCPPYPGEHVVPPPLVIGDGSLAAELVRRILVAGWRDGRRPVVHCMSGGSRWVEELRGDVPDYSLELIDGACLSPARAADAARRLVAGWAPPPKGKGDAAGLRVYVALRQDALALPIARAVLRALPDARVALVVEDGRGWGSSLGADDQRLVWISRGTLLSDPAVLNRGPVDLLRDELVADARAWPPENPSVFGQVVRDAGGALTGVRGDQARLAAGVEQLVADGARLTLDVLQAGGLDVRAGGQPSEPPIVGPAALRKMASILIEGMGDVLPPGPVSTAWAVETAARLPGLVQCAGWAVRASEAPLLEVAAVERLAPLVHQAYVAKQADLRNPTQSTLATAAWAEMSEYYQASNRAVVRDYPVKLALVGLDWRRADDPVLFALSDDQVDLLAEAEHRRWSHFQRRNGAEGHSFVKPWTELGSERGLDRSNVEMMARALAAEGVEIFDPVAPAASHASDE